MGNGSTLPAAHTGGTATPSDGDRMGWWRDARFGMFIHWGLYSIPAGQWEDADGTRHTNYGEWLLSEAHIPVDQYEKLKDKFNPVKFDADAWVKAAKGAGMNYVVITTKHHDGFCLFDSRYTDYNVISTPFRRDIMREMSDACRKQGMTIGWYHSIMDWHHPDYLPRRPWETRPTEGADFDRYDLHLKNQVAELLTHYGPVGVMWFDGQWEGTWTHERGLDLAAHVRRLAPRTIVNNRVDKGGGALGMTRGKEFAGDFGTPEQEIPLAGFPGVDWETCMTMNDHWGYNSADQNFKSSEDLIRKLADIASKGGNFLLNVGPDSQGQIPATSLERLRDIGRWMDVYAESIHSTRAGPFETLPWGRCTQRTLAPGAAGAAPPTRLYLHVFNWPKDGQLGVPGIFNEALGAHLLADPASELAVSRRGDQLVIAVPHDRPDDIDTVVALDIKGAADIASPPLIKADTDIFVGTHVVMISSAREKVELRYTLDGTDPVGTSPIASGPVQLAETSTVTARAFRGGQPVSPAASRTYTRVAPQPAIGVTPSIQGVNFQYFEGNWKKIPDFAGMTPVAQGHVNAFDRKPRSHDVYFGFRYKGFVSIPADGVYTFTTASDDGSTLSIDNRLVVDNDGLHSLQERSGSVALAKGYHAITVDFFECTGGQELEVFIAGPGMSRRTLPASELSTLTP